MKKWKIKKNYQQWFDDFFGYVLLIGTSKNGQVRIKKFVKTLLWIFRKIRFSTENTIIYDVTFSVILSIVPCMYNWKRYWKLPNLKIDCTIKCKVHLLFLLTKFRYFEKAKQIWKQSPPFIWRYMAGKFKRIGSLFKNFVAFAEYLNFTISRCFSVTSM